MISHLQTVFLLAALTVTAAGADTNGRILQPADIFALENVSDPQISQDGERVVYVRVSRDVMKDRSYSSLWMADFDGAWHRPVTSGERNDSSPRWSPDGRRLLFISHFEGRPQIYVRWMETGETARLTNLTHAPSGPAWSPDGNWIAFSMFVPGEDQPVIEMPRKPEGAEWAKPPRMIERVIYRFDGSGFAEDGHRQIFVLPAEGGTPRQITSGDIDHPGPRGGALSWTADGKAILFSANRREDRDYTPTDTEVYRVDVGSGRLEALTDRRGPDAAPVMSPDGSRIAYTGYDDAPLPHQVSKLYVMNSDGSGSRELTGRLDRSVSSPVWTGDGNGLFFLYTDEGETKIAYTDLEGSLSALASQVGGTSLGRPYASGSFSAAANGRFAYTWTDPHNPARLAAGERGGAGIRQLADLNEDVLGHKKLGDVEEIRYRSSFDGREIHGWVMKPPESDAARKYPLILEIHGGPVANYGPRFSAEMQLYAAAGYVTLYTNPRGSDSYGSEFGNLIHHNYPGEDFDDLMSGVDAVIARGYIDPERLYVTGGSGGGVLSSWIVGKTDRFAAAVVGKPVINWYSWLLTADIYSLIGNYWFPGPPWEHQEHYMKRSPISLAGNVKTPTMVLTGEVDYRTPMSESEQFYQALKLRKVDAALVRVPGASHDIAARPSHLIAKVAYVLEWFGRYGGR